MLKRLWLDEGGAVLSAELILLLVVLIIGIGVGLVALRDAVNAKLVDVGSAIAQINPNYILTGVLYTPPAEWMIPDAGMASVTGSYYVSTVAIVDNVELEKPGVVLAGTTPGA